MRYVLLLLLGFLLVPTGAQAAAPLLFRYQHHIFTLDPDHYPAWSSAEESWTMNGAAYLPPAHLRVDGDDVPPLPPGLVRTTNFVWNTAAIAATIDRKIGVHLNRAPGQVRISLNSDGQVEFDGVGMQGREIDLAEAGRLTAEAMRLGITDITLPVIELPAQVAVLSPELQDRGILEVISVGESDYTGSPNNRKHNIATGLSKFNGVIVPQGSVFSFNEILGPVNAVTGYRKELVIQGDKTLPDYGGGLCQVSTTAYRGVWEYGFPIDQRINHSYSVRYYFPEGTDATIYPPFKDVKFTNDSPGDMLIQTHTEDDKAYFIYYGTRDKRTSEIVGPFVWGKTSPPADKVEYTTDIPAGTSRKVGSRVPGMKSGWFRVVAHPGDEEEVVESFYSSYEARPQYTQYGVSAANLQPIVASPAETAAAQARREERLREQQKQQTSVSQPRSVPSRTWTTRVRRRR